MKQLALENAIKGHIKRAGLSQAAVARKLHYTPEQFNKWVRGVNRIPDIAIQEFSDLLGLTDEERTELFTLAGYVAITTLPKKVAANGDTVSINGDDIATFGDRRLVPFSFGRPFFIDALKDWNNNFFRWSEASDYRRSSWTGLVIYMMSALTKRITPRGILIFCLSLLLGMVTIQLMMPVLQWPLNDIDDRWMAYLKYGLATWLIPLLLAFVTPPDKDDLFQLETTKQRMTCWILKFTAALAGFWIFSILVICLSLIWYYLYWPPLAGVSRAVLALFPLFFSYVAARRIPVDRHKMFDGELRLHPVDHFVLVAFVLVGPFTAFFLHFSYWFLSDRRFAPIIIIIFLTGLVLWEYRKQDRRSISDPVLILILGLVIPFFIPLYAFLLTPGLSHEWPYIIVISIYFLSWTLLMVTLFVRNKPSLTLPGAVGLFAVVIVAGLTLLVNPWLGAGFVFIVVLMWTLWGQKRFRNYFWIHSSFWVMGLAAGACLYFLASNTIPLWANGLGFIIISIALIGWAYRAH